MIHGRRAPPRPGPGIVSALLAATGLLVAPVTAARSGPDAPAITLSFDACPDELAPQVERIARIELHAPSSSREGAQGAATAIRVICADDEVRLAVDDGITAKRVERSVSLAGVPRPGRARLLALAIAELVRSSWIELALAPPPLPAVPLPSPPGPDAPAAPAEPSAPTADEKERALAVASEGRPKSAIFGYAVLEGLYAPTVGTPLIGLTLGVQREVYPSLFVDGAIAGWDGAASRATGAITVRALALDPALYFDLPHVEVGAGARIGWTSLSGAPSVANLQGQTTSGVIAGPFVAATARIVGPVGVWLRTGWFLHGARGRVSGDSDVTLGGYWASLGLGLRIGS